ncbi:diguanylate cyclase [Deinococcus hohokamensis]|uniref:Diguanylate cyclase n=1 Tax=Deinococcus hohokamensis TaxID=309883 RepID=A0ABV9ICA5_9DEIO
MRLSTVILRTFSALWLFTLLGGLAVYWSIERNNQAMRRSQQQQQEITQITGLLKSVLDLETGLRGYLLTGEPVFLEPHTAARARLPGELSALEQALLSGDVDPAHTQTHLQALSKTRTLIEEWFLRAAQPQLAAYRTNPAQAVRLVKTQTGKHLIDAIRQQLGGLSQHLDAERRQQEAANQASLRRLQFLTPFGVALALLASVLVSARLTSSVAQTFARLRASTRQLASGDLQARAPLSPLYEARLLAEDFNGMAAALLQAQHDAEDRHALLERRNLEVTQLAELSDSLQSCQNTDEGYRLLAVALPRLFPEWSGSFSTLNASKNILERRVAWGTPGSPEETGLQDPALCWALRRGHAYTPSELGLPCVQHGGQNAAYLCLPLLTQNEALGTLQLFSAPGTPPLPEHTRRYAQAVGQQLGLALGNLRLRESLRQQSIRDPMTGLFNRRYLEETLEREVYRARRTGSPLSVLGIDVDHFKTFNDSYGHEAGDSVLMAVARAMQEFFRGEDIVCRYGGEEFIVVLLNASHADTLARADAFRTHIAALSVRHDRQTLGPVTVSIGVASFPEHADLAPALLNQADQALYLAKRSGRNRVDSAGALGRQP